ncbi:GNAT family N-acetyltransferase [Pontibacter qinzhouensis]|uniref:GNAT family N-acetyltransferase n=1 Tax=Pontibacter qinzhouensis TaxID=2603253 RepID=A0A5C8JL45_9BACT|nr:GNAT family N-acetyltransferase [Pontibacter qinzhouensis]TXK37991.1 GNAT family N-acetyltransferase [Pontibacter qinzhouensis]
MTTPYCIRTATEADITAIKQLADATWEPTYRHILSQEQIAYMFSKIYTEEALLEQMQAGQTFLLLQEQNEPIGFASISEKDAEKQVYKLNKIYLLPSCQGRGLGRVLLNSAEAMALAKGAHIIDLNVNRHNQALIFYQSCGYHVLQEEDIPIGPYYMNDYVLRKELYG